MDTYNGSMVPPCRVKSFQKVVSTVMDDLELGNNSYNNFNLIIKTCQCVSTLIVSSPWGIRRGGQGSVMFA